MACLFAIHSHTSPDISHAFLSKAPGTCVVWPAGSCHPTHAEPTGSSVQALLEPGGTKREQRVRGKKSSDAPRAYIVCTRYSLKDRHSVIFHIDDPSHHTHTSSCSLNRKKESCRANARPGGTLMWADNSGSNNNASVALQPSREEAQVVYKIVRGSR